MNINTDQLNHYVQQVREQFEQALAQIVDVPTVSADPAHARDFKRGTATAERLLNDAGFETEIVPTRGYPVLFGQLVQDPAFPTVTIYNHMDVQPADAAEWHTDPFKMTVKDNRYYGRGATDDKGPGLSALFAVLFAREQRVPLNFNFIWEFEEEVGSPHFDDFMQSKGRHIQTDSIVIGDGVWVAPGQPALPMGLRGMMAFEISLQTSGTDVHSGLAGGVARNPLGELAAIVSECYDAASGRVHVPGFYDQVQPPTAEEAKHFLNSGFNVKQFMADLDLKSVRTTDTAEVVTRIMAEPTFEVHGFTGGYTGPGVKTVIPAKASVKLSCRLVANQKPAEIFQLIRDFIVSRHPDADVNLIATLDPYLNRNQGQHMEAAVGAITAAFGKKPALVREGGSVGALLTMTKYLDAPVQMLPLSLPEQGWHAPNEYYDWGQASGGIKMYAHYFAAISSLKRQPSAAR